MDEDTLLSVLKGLLSTCLFVAKVSVWCTLLAVLNIVAIVLSGICHGLFFVLGLVTIVIMELCLVFCGAQIILKSIGLKLEITKNVDIHYFH